MALTAWVSGGLRPVTFRLFEDLDGQEEPCVTVRAWWVFARSREAFAQAEQWLAGPEAAGLEHAALEKGLAARGREIQRRLLQDHLDARAAAEARLAQVTGPDGICRTLGGGGA